jgi:hypothetical protein
MGKTAAVTPLDTVPSTIVAAEEGKKQEAARTAHRPWRRRAKNCVLSPLVFCDEVTGRDKDCCICLGFVAILGLMVAGLVLIGPALRLETSQCVNENARLLSAPSGLTANTTYCYDGLVNTCVLGTTKCKINYVPDLCAMTPDGALDILKGVYTLDIVYTCYTDKNKIVEDKSSYRDDEQTGELLLWMMPVVFAVTVLSAANCCLYFPRVGPKFPYVERRARGWGEDAIRRQRELGLYKESGWSNE